MSRRQQQEEDGDENDGADGRSHHGCPQDERLPATRGGDSMRSAVSRGVRSEARLGHDGILLNGPSGANASAPRPDGGGSRSERRTQLAFWRWSLSGGRTLFDLRLALSDTRMWPAFSSSR